eukprot:gene28904-8356_t
MAPEPDRLDLHLAGGADHWAAEHWNCAKCTFLNNSLLRACELRKERHAEREARRPRAQSATATRRGQG